MENVIIENYIASNYKKWLRRVRRHCYVRDLKGVVAEDVLQDVMYVVFTKKPTKDVLDMISTKVHQHYTLFDIFISRTVHNRLFNETRHDRVVNRIVVYGLDLSRLNNPTTDIELNMID